jgi:hypothetical protein
MAYAQDITCRRCEKPTVRSCNAYSRMCLDCADAHQKEGRLAVKAVRKLVLRGDKPKASACMCVDCGKQALDYDHRDYTKPLDVVPVCRSCNQKRSSAYDSVYRPAAERATA